MTKLITLRKEDIPCLRNILSRRAIESNLAEQPTVEKYMEFLMLGYDQQVIGAYADDLVDPKICLLMVSVVNPASDTKAAHILLIYVDPLIRGNPSVFSDLVTYAENYTKLVGATHLVSSSWTFRGSRSISALWEKFGFEEQEIKYIKFV